jgi:uncharacterized protein (TIGR02246 family)
MRYLVLATVIFATLASCAQNETNSNNQTETAIQTKSNDNMEKEEKKKIEGLLSTYQTCLNTSNAKLAQSLYTKDGVFMPTEAPSGIGAEGILKSYEFVFAQIQLNIEFQIEEIQVEGNMAFAITSSKGTVKIHANGVEVPEANRELFVFEKVEGEWKIARYMFNKTEPKG